MLQKYSYNNKKYVEVEGQCSVGDLVIIKNGHPSTVYHEKDNGKIVKIIEDVPQLKNDIIKKHYITSEHKVLYKDQYTLLKEIPETALDIKQVFDLYKNNKNIKFQLYDINKEDIIEKKQYYIDENGILKYSQLNNLVDEQVTVDHNILNALFVLMEESVDFQTAINSGYKIKFKGLHKYMKLKRIFNILSTKNEKEISRIINGEWFIEK